MRYAVPPRLALCGEPYHPINSCLPCKATWMRNQRAKNRKPRNVGFKGPECLECGGIRSRVEETGYTEDAQRLRSRTCLDCGARAASIEIYVPAATFWQLAATEHRTRKREVSYAKRGKGLYRTAVRSAPDRIEVDVRVRRERAA